MKILRLDLLAFGPFTNLALDLASGSEGLHIIYGPNEAGKSCALRALRQVFYDIPGNSSDAFLHPYPQLRIGAKIRRNGDDCLTFVRRKGNKNTLRAENDSDVLEEAELMGFLGQVDQQLFATVFGIDHETLVQGGKAIVKGGGDIGQILFAAASGLADLRSVLDGLQAETEALFKSGGSKPAINHAMSELERVRKALRDAELPSAKWVEQDEILRKALDRKRETEDALTAKTREKNRLDRIKESLPAIAERKQLLAGLVDLADAVILPEDFPDKRRIAVEQLRGAERDEKEAMSALGELNDRIVQLDVPVTLLEQAELIESLHLRLGSHLKALKDRPNLETQFIQSIGDARGILNDLQPGLELDQANELRLTASERVNIQNLGNEHQSLVKGLAKAKDDVEKGTKQIARKAKELADLEAPRDGAALQKAVRRAQQQGDSEEELNTSRQDLQRMEQKASVDLQKLTLWSGTLEELERLAIPSNETIERCQANLEDVDNNLTRLRTRIDELSDHLAELEQQEEQLRIEQEVPTEEDLHSARQRRGEGWELVRRSWKEGVEDTEIVVAFAAGFNTGSDLAAAYEFSVEDADTVADRLRREADRVATRARLLADRTSCLERLAALDNERVQFESRRERILEDWRALWQPLGTAPLSPKEMLGWTRRQAELVTQAKAIREQLGKVNSLEDRILRHQRELSERLQQLGEPRAGADETLALLLDRGQGVVDHITEVTRTHERLRDDLAKLEDQLEESKAQAEETGTDLGRWRQQWAQVTLKLRLREDATPAEANAIVERNTALFEKKRIADGYRERIKGIDRDAEQFATDVASLAERVAPDLVDVPVEQAAAELNARLARGRTAKRELETLTEQRDKEKEKLSVACKTIEDVKAQLTTMCQEAGCDSYEDLTEAETRSTSKLKIEQDVKRLEKQLLAVTGGQTVERFIAEAEAEDADTLGPRIALLEEQIEGLRKENSELDQTIGGATKLLATMDGAPKASEQAEIVQQWLAQIASDSEQYARLRLASVVLRQAIERYREKNQGPVLTRASELFADLTLGSFQGLRADYNERGDPVLMGVRPGGRETVGVEGMSDGSADQLYLALRLASLEAYLAKGEPLPFIVDDVLLNFDNDRAVAALRTLAKLSERTQVIFFTHHRHLVDLAESNLDQCILFRHELEIYRIPAMP